MKEEVRSLLTVLGCDLCRIEPNGGATVQMVLCKRHAEWLASPAHPPVAEVTPDDARERARTFWNALPMSLSLRVFAALTADEQNFITAALTERSK